jgi:hypothetical protein
MHHQQLNENLSTQDLVNLVGNKIHFDEYDSKMGDNPDVVTASFKIKQRMPAKDLVTFIENGYDWILDADVSSGEITDGEYLVFVEMPRRSQVFEQMIELLDDLHHLTDIKLNEWKFRWYKDNNYYPLEETSIKQIVPDSPAKYKQMVEQFGSVKQEQNSLNDEILQIKKLSGIG